MRHLTCSADFVNPSDFALEAQEDIADVLDSGFLTWRCISSSAEPLVVAFLPVSQESRVVRVLLVGHKTSGVLQKDLLNLYLGLAGLVGTTAARLASEEELNIYRRRLEELVGERTGKLTRINEQLEHEIVHRKRAEEALQEAHDQLEFRVQERTTELENTKWALTAERKRLFDILETMPAMVCLLRPDYRVAFANRSLREKFGEEHGRPCFEYRFGLKEPCGFCETFSVLKTGKPHRWEFTRPDGSIIDAYDLPFTDTDGSSLILEINVDVTELKSAQTERERLITELEAKNTELESFVYAVSHDLKSPLITISAFLGFVERAVRTGNTTTLESDLAKIYGAIDRMAQLLDEVLKLSRIGRMANPPGWVSMTDLAHEALEILSGRLIQHAVEVNVKPSLPKFYGDRPRLLEVVQNLMENAMKFMGRQPHPRIEIGSREDNGQEILYVRDNGIGINPLYHEKVFGLFNKLDRKSEGTGVGLALAKRILEVHGGRIWFESDGPGKGCTFFSPYPVLLPNRQYNSPRPLRVLSAPLCTTILLMFPESG